ncbi:unnamed protein product [Linum trigynum]|uniref:TF-B3 domain-containing protein n=1 Tax=Linum trigynum TaxID=586398 RepID=A0AAV2ELL2_9ROSI
MAATVAGRRPEGCLLFEPSAPHFSKQILRQTLHTNRLLIPRSFARKHGRELSDRATLQVPGPMTWKVEVSRADNEGRLWFQNDGFKRFREFYSLTPGYTVVFRYNGGGGGGEDASLFSVLIFDPTGSEIQYPVIIQPTAAAVGDDRLKLRGGDVGKKLSNPSRDSEGFSDGCSPANQRRRRSRSPLKVNSCSPPPRKRVMVGDSARNDGAIGRMPESERRVLPNSRSAGGIGCGKQLFRDELADEEKPTCKRAPSGQTETASRGRESERSVLHSSRNEVGSKVEQLGEEEVAVAFTSSKPCFQVKLGKRPVGSHITIPSSFSALYFKKDPVFLKLKVGARSWGVKAMKRYRASYRICGGWLDFARDNSLQEGEVCCFELIQKEGLVLRVSVCNTLLLHKK